MNDVRMITLPAMQTASPSHSDVRVIACPRPFSIDRIDKAVPHGASLADMLRDIGLHGDVHARVFIDDQLISQAFWECTRPKPGHTVTVRVVPTGGGGSGSKNALRIVAMIGVLALSLAVPAFAPAGLGLTTAAGGLTLAGAFVATGISLAGSLLVNARIPPPRPRLLTNGAQL